jgi:pimeloyl-ACP methyl ester carboxylesterase
LNSPERTPDGSGRLRRVVLVHGAGHGAWCWEALVPRLTGRGLRVDTLDLPGLGDDPTPPREVTFQSYVDAITRVIEAGPGRVLLLGHSMGGWPISAVGEAIPERIGKLVYIASMLPKDNETIGELAQSLSRFNEPSAFRCMRRSDVDGAHEFIAELAAQTFYHLCPPDVAKRAVARLRPQADAPRSSPLPLRLSAERWGGIPKTYIVCSQDRALPVSAQHWFCERAPEVKKRVMHTDHSPFFSDPDGLAAAIAEEL